MLLLNEKDMQKLEKSLLSPKRIPTAEEQQLLYRMIYILYDELIAEKERTRRHEKFFDVLTILFACVMVVVLVWIAIAVTSSSPMHLF